MLGLLLVAIVTAASVQDSTGGHHVLDQLADTHPSVSTAWVDGGYNNTVIRHRAQHGIRVEVVKAPPPRNSTCCLPLERRTNPGLAHAAPLPRP